jgi:hypothetical protein
VLLCRAAKPVAESHIAKDAPRQIPSNLKTSPVDWGADHGFVGRIGRDLRLLL